MRRLLAVGLLAVAGVTSVGCQDEAPPPPLSSLRRSGEATFLCVGPDGEGAPLERCPQGQRLARGGLTVAREGHELISLITQTISGEVAVVQVTGSDAAGNSTGAVLDVDPSTPGVTPLRVGREPVDIVTTPGGRASFVGVGDVGKEGIFALPTSCIFAPEGRNDETDRDLTTWPACSLPSAPGAMVVAVDPADEAGRERLSCDRSYQEELPVPASAEREECRVDLREETTTGGRSKLYVALPKEGRVVILDAQALLDRQPGSFSSCLDPSADEDVPVFQGELQLEVDLEEPVVQSLPDDLVEPGCRAPTVQYGPFTQQFEPRPAGMASRAGTLLIADRGAPVIHRVDIHDPCSPKEVSPLVATSLLEQDRVVTTSKVAISPETPDGKKYAYAIDEVGTDHSSIMVFDLSPGATTRTPLVRPHSAEMPLEPPDRIEFASPVKDVAFALFDQPLADPVTGTGVLGTMCEPDPAADSNSVGARYRPGADFATGAHPGALRGLFAYALLGDGAVSLIDIEDFDAPCRRPITLNPSSVPDFRGCAGDPERPRYYTSDGTLGGDPTVTDEASCSIVEPHRARSGSLLLRSDVGNAAAPGLASYGRLRLDGRGLPVSRLTVEGKRRPIMLGVNFDAPPPRVSDPAQVWVGNVLREVESADRPLVIDPNTADQITMSLPFRQPRAYPQEETVAVTYEGTLGATQRTGRLELGDVGGDGSVVLAEQPAIADAQGVYCDAGVQDLDLTRSVGMERFGLTGGALERFARRHADYVQITSEILPEEDPYWETEVGGQCGQRSSNASVTGFAFCDARFGDGEGSETVPERDLRILRAFQERLEVEPRSEGQGSQQLLRDMQCCFPGLVSYHLRAGHQWVVQGSTTGFQHAVEAVAVSHDGRDQFRCMGSCDPLRAGLGGRAFEISNARCEVTTPEDPRACGVGPRTGDDVVCVYDGSTGPVGPGTVASECIFDGLTRRFAIYRGLEPSRRDMAFSVTVNGGFRNQRISLTGETSNVLPVSLVPIPTFDGLGVVDSQDRGLIILDMKRPRVADQFF